MKVSENRLPKPRLQLQKYLQQNGSTQEIVFNRGLTLLHGSTQTHRTILLRLIRFAMGGNANRIDRNALAALESVSLEILTNHSPIRIVRSCKHPTGQLTVYDLEGSLQLYPNDLSGFLLDKLQLPQVYMTRTQKGKLIEVPLSMNDLARAFVVDRDISYSSILNEVQREPRIELIKLLMGFTTREIADTENRKRALEHQILQVNQQRESFRVFLANFNTPSIIEIERERLELLDTLQQLNIQEQEYQSQVVTQINSQEVGAERYAQLRDELINSRIESDRLQRDILSLRRQIEEKEELKSLLNAEERRMDRQFSAGHVISTFTFSQCPRCLQAITPDMRAREEDEQCMLCGRPLARADEDETVEDWRKAQHDVKQTIREVQQLIDNYRGRIEVQSQKAIGINQRIEWLAKVINEETTRFVSPLVEQTRLISAERTKIEKRLSELAYEQRQREYGLYLEEQELPRLEKQLDDMNQELSQMQYGMETSAKRYYAFATHFRYFIKHVTMDTTVDDVSWSEAEMLPLVNDQSHQRALTGPDLAIGVLAFHYALLAMGVAEPKVSTNHPGLLIVDEPEQQKMGKERYKQVLELFGKLAEQYPDDVQIIIATDEKDIPAELEHYAIEI